MDFLFSSVQLHYAINRIFQKNNTDKNGPEGIRPGQDAARKVDGDTARGEGMGLQYTY